MDTRYDAIVVGARCAGASTAMLLARSGMKVLAVDRDREGSDTVSTHALMRGGVLQLHRWGLLDEIAAAGTPAIRTTTFHYADEAIEIPIKPKDGIDALIAPRRTVLDSVLVDAARRSGAEVVHGVSAEALARDAEGRVRGARLRRRDGSSISVAADLVVGADGLRSRVARLAGAGIEHEGVNASGVVYAYYKGFGADAFHWHYAPGVSVGVIPTNDDLTCVFAAMPEARFKAEYAGGLEALHRQVLAECSAQLARAAGQAERVGRFSAFPGVKGFVRRSWGPGWALVGDAGFFRDPITAHGMTDALRDAELLARAASRGSDRALAGYQAERDRFAVGMMELSDEVGSYAWDLERVKVLHLELSRQMNAEVDLLRRLDPVPGPRAGRAPEAACPTRLPARAAV